MIKAVMEHKPVMSEEVTRFLNLKPGDVVLDCTIGTGGHAQEILKRILPKGRLIGIDRDADSLSLAEEKLKEFSGFYTLIKDDFRHLDTILEDLKVEEINGIFFDLGISSFQLENSQRGFGIRSDGPLDMRMDKESYISAYDLVNSLSESEISSIIKNFGQERWHNRIAHLLVKQRSSTPISTTKELSDIVIRAVGYRRYSSQKIHPATRTFQAFRIAVNRELEALDIALEKAIKFLKKGGRICVISFHSLEDKIVKEKFRSFAGANLLKIITKKPLRPTAAEIELNIRSRSAKLRVAERI